MLGSNSLEVAIGLIFVYLLLSLVCTSMTEAVASLLNKRGTNLFEGVKNLLNDPHFTGLAQQLYSHGLVSSISQWASDEKKTNRLPSYMPKKIFSLALVDILGSLGVGASWSMVVQQRERTLALAKEKADAEPADPALARAVIQAASSLQEANDKSGVAADISASHDVARVAAQKVRNRSDFANLQVASAALASALAAGRRLAAEHPDPLGNLEQAVLALPPGHTRESLLVIIDRTRREVSVVSRSAVAGEQHLEMARANIEQWYEDAMDRVTGWYKRWTQLILAGLALVLVVAANADTLMLASHLARDDALRASIVAAAADVARAPGDGQGAGDAVRRADVLQEARSLAFPLGWTYGAAAATAAGGNASGSPVTYDAERAFPTTLVDWLLKVIGLILTVAAVSLGAPFWFDTLSKFVNLRSAGTPPGQHTKSDAPPDSPRNRSDPPGMARL